MSTNENRNSLLLFQNPFATIRLGDNMNALLVLMADILLAVNMVVQKKYQASEGAGMKPGFKFNALGGLAASVIFFCISGFKLEFSVFSLMCATVMSICSLMYALLGFRILRDGNTALYSVFLMSGGMLLPYVFGIFVLDETVTVLRIIGIVVMLIAVFLSANVKMQFTPKLILLCIAVFVLNGCVSIISKVHQINTTYSPVSSSAFVMYSNLIKSIFSGVALLFLKNKTTAESTRKGWFADNKMLFVIFLSAAVSGLSYLFQLVGAKELPASVLYPLVTGGTIVLSALAGKLFCKEKLSTSGIVSVALCLVGTLLFL